LPTILQKAILFEGGPIIPSHILNPELHPGLVKLADGALYHSTRTKHQTRLPNLPRPFIV
jgi:hypothetical protein